MCIPNRDYEGTVDLRSTSSSFPTIQGTIDGCFGGRIQQRHQGQLVHVKLHFAFVGFNVFKSLIASTVICTASRDLSRV